MSANMRQQITQMCVAMEMAVHEIEDEAIRERVTTLKTKLRNDYNTFEETLISTVAELDAITTKMIDEGK